MKLIQKLSVLSQSGELADQPVEESVDVATDTASTQVQSNCSVTVVTMYLQWQPGGNHGIALVTQCYTS